LCKGEGASFGEALIEFESTGGPPRAYQPYQSPNQGGSNPEDVKLKA